jgi:hypothetical protein
MAEKTIKIQLLPDERRIILRHGYPFERLARALNRFTNNEAIKTIGITEYELEMLIGELSRTFNHGEAGADEDALLALCDRLEYIEQTGDGTLDILW